LDQKPIENVCWVSVAETAIFVHYLGDRDQVRLREDEGDMYWGPIAPPP
jgi:hypothetical protein